MDLDPLRLVGLAHVFAPHYSVQRRRYANGADAEMYQITHGRLHPAVTWSQFEE